MTPANTVCRYWVGSDTKGHVCGDDLAEGRAFCAKHFEIMKKRASAQIDAQRARQERSEAAWRARNAHRLPGWRVSLERAEAEHSRRTTSVVQDRAAVGGSMHSSVVRAQRSSLSDSNVARVAELERIIGRLRADIARAQGVSS